MDNNHPNPETTELDASIGRHPASYQAHEVLTDASMVPESAGLTPEAQEIGQLAAEAEAVATSVVSMRNRRVLGKL